MHRICHLDARNNKSKTQSKAVMADKNNEHGTQSTSGQSVIEKSATGAGCMGVVSEEREGCAMLR